MTEFTTEEVRDGTLQLDHITNGHAIWTQQTNQQNARLLGGYVGIKPIRTESDITNFTMDGTTFAITPDPVNKGNILLFIGCRCYRKHRNGLWKPASITEFRVKMYSQALEGFIHHLRFATRDFLVDGAHNNKIVHLFSLAKQLGASGLYENCPKILKLDADAARKMILMSTGYHSIFVNRVQRLIRRFGFHAALPVNSDDIIDFLIPVQYNVDEVELHSPWIEGTLVGNGLEKLSGDGIIKSKETYRDGQTSGDGIRIIRGRAATTFMSDGKKGMAAQHVHGEDSPGWTLDDIRVFKELEENWEKDTTDKHIDSIVRPPTWLNRELPVGVSIM